MNKTYIAEIKHGYSKMSDLKVVICTTVRDCDDSLTRNIPVMEKLRSHIKESHVVVVENDSIDNTKKIINDWKKYSTNVHINSTDYGVITIPKHEEIPSISRFFSDHRISLMAKYRNIYLDFVKNHLDVDYLITVDLDVYYIDIDGIANSFGQEVNWDCISSNGKKVTPESPFKLQFFDTYAFKELNDTNPQTIEKIKLHQKKYSTLKLGMPIIRINSGFNGLAIYKWDSIKDLNYQSKKNDDKIVLAKCEHVTFHQDMMDNGHDQIYVNPSQIILYENPSIFFYLTKFAKIILTNLKIK